MSDDASELLVSARADLTKGFTVRAATRFRQAADTGDATAILQLAKCVLERRIPGRATEIRDRLEKLTDPTADLARLRSTLRYIGTGGPLDPNGSLSDLNGSAQQGHLLSALESAVLWDQFDTKEALPAARAWMRHLKEMSEVRNTELAAVIEAVEEQVPAAASPNPPPLETWPSLRTGRRERIYLSTEPEIYTLHDILSPLECAWLREIARPHLTASKIYDPATGKVRRDPVRTSDAMYFDASNISPLVLRTIDKILRHVEHDSARAEPMAILRYLARQEYRLHYDWLSEASLAKDPLRQAGQRIATVLVYLNTPESGGATTFPRLGLQIPAKQGQLLYFSNVDGYGHPDKTTLHAGTPVISGTKWVSSLWLRQHKINA